MLWTISLLILSLIAWIFWGALAVGYRTMDRIKAWLTEEELAENRQWEVHAATLVRVQEMGFGSYPSLDGPTQVGFLLSVLSKLIFWPSYADEHLDLWEEQAVWMIRILRPGWTRWREQSGDVLGEPRG